VRRFRIKAGLASTQEGDQPKKREYVPTTNTAKLKRGWQVMKTDPETDEKTSLTQPSHLYQARNSKRRLEGIGIENLDIIHSDWFKKPKKKKAQDPEK